ncbi:hypothetical protein J3R75_000106 [Oligosphaera ethanolica]|uniref:Uncharacterized protein n=1 Tax=Oligosphaera ethanolica TaxID=760260 RepID=A0AAE3VCJ4_9BACT|nr:hypothetical protein [Oligosphaera ethanolica]
MAALVVGSQATASCISLQKSIPRAFELRRLNLNRYSRQDALSLKISSIIFVFFGYVSRHVH